MHNFAITLDATPLLNTPDFISSFGGTTGTSLPLDEQGLLRSVETIALPLTKLNILEKTAYPYILRAFTDDYPYQDIYVDTRFLSFPQQEPQNPHRRLPSTPTILQKLLSLCGTRYIWGGNWPLGIPSLPLYYPPHKDLSLYDPLIADSWLLKGVDCSGLLYYATDGYTPRNTSSLLSYGKEIPIQHRNTDSIIPMLQPLDLIVWKGHVIIIVDDHNTIESLSGKGVITTSILERLDQLTSSSMMPHFVIRRWL